MTFQLSKLKIILKSRRFKSTDEIKTHFSELEAINKVLTKKEIPAIFKRLVLKKNHDCNNINIEFLIIRMETFEPVFG